MNNCMLCTLDPDSAIWSDNHCAVVLDTGSEFTGWCKVVWKAHVTEYSQLSEEQACHFMKVVRNVELAIISVFTPDKVNLTSLGLQVPHLHMHVTPRYIDDSRYPKSVWELVVRDVSRPGATPEDVRKLQFKLDELLNKY